MTRRLALCIGLAVALTMPASAQPDDRAARIVRAWSDWARAGQTTTATIAVLRSGEPVAAEGLGVPPHAALPLASLSKAITAACVAASEAHGLSPVATIGDHLDDPAPLADRTVAQLLTHAGGIGPDATQGDAALRRASGPQVGTVARRALGRDAQQGAVGAFAYNNENDAILGAMIQAATGRPYAAHCADAVLAPLGIRSASMDGEWGAHGPWGGWSMSAADYARFAWATFGSDGVVGRAPERWPWIDVGGGARYGMGALTREVRDHRLYWAFGMLCWDGEGDGAYFASYGGEWLVVTLFAGCLAGTDRMAALDAALFEAALD